MLLKKTLAEQLDVVDIDTERLLFPDTAVPLRYSRTKGNPIVVSARATLLNKMATIPKAITRCLLFIYYPHNSIAPMKANTPIDAKPIPINVSKFELILFIFIYVVFVVVNTPEAFVICT